MINKKLLIILPFLTLSTNQLAQAKTKGAYLSASAIQTRFEFPANNASISTNKNDKTKESFGFDLKYAFNYKNFFVAPKLFYDYNNFSRNIYDVLPVNSLKIYTEYNLRYSYGFGFDIGYDITKKLSLYGVFLNKFNKFNLKDQGTLNINGQDISYGGRVDMNFKSLVYGIGVKYQIYNNIDLFLNYEPSIKYKSSNLDKDPNNKSYTLTRLGISVKLWI